MVAEKSGESEEISTGVKAEVEESSTGVEVEVKVEESVIVVKKKKMGNDKPPTLTGQNYDMWKLTLESWKVITEADEKKWGHMIVFHSCDEKLREELYANVNAEALKSNTGHGLVIQYLDKKFKVDDKIKQFIYFDEFIEYKRNEEDILVYIDQFERKVDKLKAVDCALSDMVLAHTLLKNAGLSEEAKATIKATATDLSFKEVKATMMKVYSKTFGSKDASQYGKPIIKEEVMYTDSNYRGDSSRGNPSRGSSRGQRRGSFRGRGRDDAGQGREDKRKNYNDYSTGKPVRCYNCDSEYHLSNRCPHPRKEKLGKRKRSSSQDRPNSIPTYYTEDSSEQEPVEIQLMQLAEPRL